MIVIWRPGLVTLTSNMICFSILSVFFVCWTTRAVLGDASEARTWENPCGMIPANMTPEEVKPMQMPWIARLGYKNNQSKIRYMCSGSLIDRRHVLTAAHCVLPGQLPTTVRIRKCDDAHECEGVPHSFGVARIARHPDYTSLTTCDQHDIAVIRLNRDVNLVGPMRAVCLPITEDTRPVSLDEDHLVLGGWRIHEQGMGSPPGNGVLRSVTVPWVPFDTCQEQYSDIITLQADLQICAGGKGVEPCRGEAGAPLHTLQGRRMVQVGVASFGLPQCGNTSLPTVYTRVEPYMRWIQRIVTTEGYPRNLHHD